MTIAPKPKDRRHYSYDEADEPPGLIDKETTDIEREKPIDDTEPVEQLEEEEDVALAMFEE